MPEPKAEYLLLSCMDYRHMDDIVSQMKTTILGGRGAVARASERPLSHDDTTDLYDHLILAGASLGLVQQTYPTWATTFWDHVNIALKLHSKIHTVILLDHMDCGAYKTFYNLEADDIVLHDRASRMAQRQIELRTGLRVERWILEPTTTEADIWEAHQLP